MKNSPRFVKKQLCQLVAAGLLMGAGASVFANDFSLTDNAFVISNNGTTIATATVGSD